ncbi:hypothetical protein GGI12_001128 [Dipsacomyces acuminosporus]|nr:hypothetical protein GGI12_001128 [Dipsacomyces acuminosporus]
MDPEEIDGTLLELFDVLARYRQGRSSSSKALKQAYFDLAQARRSAGYRWVSPDQYSGNARAIATVDIDEATGQIALSRERDHDGQGAGAGSSDPDVQADRPRLRLRRSRRPENESSKDSDDGSTSSASRSDDESSSEAGEASPAKTPASTNPLHWFGLLTPPKLRDAQSGFIESLDQLVALAELQRSVMQKQRLLAQALLPSAQ